MINDHDDIGKLRASVYDVVYPRVSKNVSKADRADDRAVHCPDRGDNVHRAEALSLLAGPAQVYLTGSR